MARDVHHWLRTAVLASLIAAAAGCASSNLLSAFRDPMNASVRGIDQKSAPLYVIPIDSLLTLAEGTPVQVVLHSGGKVLGTSLRSQPDSSAEFLVRAPARRMFDRPDTVQIPVANIEVTVSTLLLAGGSQPYVGPRKLGPLTRGANGPPDPMLGVVVVLTVVAMIGAVVLVAAVAGG